MHALTAPFLAAAALLAVAGALKVLRPVGTTQALRTQGLPSAGPLVRLLGLAELLIAVAALLQLPLGALLLAAAYAAFTAFVLLALVRDRPLTSCGCFGAPDLPPTRVHAVVTVALAAVAAVVATGAPAGLPVLVEQSTWLASGTLAAAGLVSWLTYLVLAELPRLVAATSAGSADGPPAATTPTFQIGRPPPALPIAPRSATP